MLLLSVIALQFLLIIYIAIQLRNLKRSVKNAQRKSIFLHEKNEKLLHTLYLSMEHLSRMRELPPSLSKVPFADQLGIVLSVKKITIPSIEAPYNASIGALENGYGLFFRYDTLSCNAPFFSNMGCMHLNSDFEPLKDSLIKIETQSEFSEDARFFQHNGRHFLIYNDRISRFSEQRGMRIAAIDLGTKKLEYITPLPMNSLKVEKNWTPFSHENEIHFLYTICPQKIFELPNPKRPFLKAVSSFFSNPVWPMKWGIPRGGTPAILIDGEYLSFFHSSFEDEKGIIWYIMGAYTFASVPPFQMTRISPCPFLFKGIYSTPHGEIANPKIRSIYPAGLIYERRDGRDVIAVSCGENDSAIKIISMDKQALFSSLQTIF